MDTRSEKIGYKLREARLDRLPYALIVGQKEADEQNVSVWSRTSGERGSSAIDDFVKLVLEDINNKNLKPF